MTPFLQTFQTDVKYWPIFSSVGGLWRTRVLGVLPRFLCISLITVRKFNGSNPDAGLAGARQFRTSRLPGLMNPLKALAEPKWRKVCQHIHLYCIKEILVFYLLSMRVWWGYSIKFWAGCTASKRRNPLFFTTGKRKGQPSLMFKELTSTASFVEKPHPAPGTSLHCFYWKVPGQSAISHHWFG